MATYNTSVTTATACPCCGPNCVTATLECRFQEGTATLCGFSEYTSPSTPAKKYRAQTLNGTHNLCGYTDGTCTTVNGFFGQRIFEWGGSYLFNSGNCAETNTQFENFSASAANGTATCNNAVFVSTITRPINFVPSDTTNTNRTTSQTVDEWEGTSTCGSSFIIRTGSVTATLSVEDTDADAIARLLPTLSWSSWITSGAFGCADSPPECCRAEWQPRTTGFTFIYRESQWRISATGLTPSTVYNYSVEIFRRTYGSGSYTLYSTIEGTGITDGGGNFEEEGDVPNDVGFQSYAASAQICEAI